MLNIVLVTDPFDPFLKTSERRSVAASSIRTACFELFGKDFVEFEYPTLALVNGEPFMRSQWDETLNDFDTVTFVRLAHGIVEWIIALIVIVVAIVIALVVVGRNNNAAIGAAPNQVQNGAPVYTLTGQSNQDKLNNAIECVYGYNKVYPALAAASYNVYSGNDQYQFSIYCIGHGYYQLTNIRIEDTDIGNFEGAQYQICPPGSVPSLCHAAVHTAATVGDIELFATDEDQYKNTPTGYAVCDPGQKVSRIEIDLSLPQGLYIMDSTGELSKATVKALFEYCLIDDLDHTTGSWQTLTSWSKKTKTIDPQRYTVGVDVPLGRYKVRGRRTNKKNQSDTGDASDAANAAAGRVADSLHWETLRGFTPYTPNFGDVTLVAVKLLATNELNNNVGNRFNCFATRMLRTWSPARGWSGLTPTRSIVWAFCDVFQANYGGRLPDSFLDLDELYQLDQQLAGEGRTFDYIFDARSTVWDAATAVAGAARGVPMLTGSQLSIVRDGPRTTATAVFNPQNIVAGSLSWGVKLPYVADNDGLQVEYMDANTWVLETVDCLVGDDQGDFPEKLKIVGVTNRDFAYRLGMYHRAVKLYQTESIEFKTGLEGHLPVYGDLILVQHDVPLWGDGGTVTSLTDVVEIVGGPVTATIINLDRPVTFDVDPTKNRIILRTRDGSAFGPMACAPVVDNPKAVQVTPALDGSIFIFDEAHDRPYFLFGLENLECKRCIVVGIEPQEDDVVTIKAAAYDDRLYQYDNLSAPPLFSLPTPVPIPSHPNMGPVKVSQSTSAVVTVYWAPVLGAQYYTVETSPDNATWTLVGEPDVAGYTFRATTDFTTTYVRVTAYGSGGHGTSSTWMGSIGYDTIPGAITGLVISYNLSGFISFSWDYTGSGYDVQVIDTASGLLVSNQPDYFSNSFFYSISQGGTDGLTSRAMTLKVRGTSTGGKGPWSTIDAVIAPIPLVPVVVTSGNTCDMYYADTSTFTLFSCDNNTRKCDANTV